MALLPPPLPTPQRRPGQGALAAHALRPALRVAVLLGLLLAGGLAPEAMVPAGAPRRAQADTPPVPDRPLGPVLTAHYELRSEGPRAEAEEWGRVLEAAWPQLKAFFHAEPPLKEGERLRVVFTESAEAWTQAIRAAGGNPPGGGAGGYYCPLSRTAFLYRQPSAWYTRTLLLHEVAHQFHFLGATGNRSPGARWYIEGVAEHLSHHAWDGTTLALGIVPLLSLENRAGLALARVSDPAFDIEALVNDGPHERPEAMHLVRFLLEGEGGNRRKRFEAMAEKLDRGGQAGALFGRSMGPPRRLLDQWRDWLPEVQEPLAPVHVDWDTRGPRAVRGTSGGVSGCRVRRPARAISATLAPQAGTRWSAGLLLHAADASQYTVALVAAGSVRVQRLERGGWTMLPVDQPPAPGGQPWRLSATREGTRVTLQVQGVQVGSYDLPGDALGLAVDGCTMDFTELAWEAVPAAPPEAGKGPAGAKGR
ncbi:MAG: hypothetical protein ACKOSS_04040 [Planctomycetia bacterium]